MKTRIISINAKFIHTALSVWYLKANCHAQDCEVMEFTINEPLMSIFCKIVPQKPDIIALSCYIWNIEHILKLSEMIKKALPNAKIILGGPEVSYTPEEIMKQYHFIDYVIMGEGEHAFSSLLKGDETAPGIVYRKDETIYVNDTYQMIEDLNSLQSPYTDEMLATLKDRILYFEASRGCPFSCSYCLSSTFDGVRYFSLDRIKSELMKLCNSGIKQIKFVDRTFNCNKKRAMDILSFIIQDTGDTHFHFEIAADLLDGEIINLLAKAPIGKIQLEIGVQSVNEATLNAVNRKTDTTKVLSNVKKLQAAGNIHLHLDLIAGLPYEDYESFMHSFDEVYKTNPHQLQLGFLKLLKGSQIREDIKHGNQFASFPPYEIISNRYISADELIELKKIEDVLDRYYNSGRFTKTLEYLSADNPFDFYCSLADFVDFNKPPSSDVLYGVLMNFIKDHPDASLISDLMKFDFLSSTRFGKLPACFFRKLDPDFKEKCFAYLKAISLETPAKEKYKTVHFEPFDYGITKKPYKKEKAVLLFDYQEQNPVTEKYFYKKLIW